MHERVLASREIELKRFFIMGNGGSGTSLLRGLLNAHSQIECAFEKVTKEKSFESAESFWKAEKHKSNALWWGNKIPFEQFITAGWSDDEIKKIPDAGYYIIWIVRRFTRYSHKTVGHRLNTYMANWDRAQKLYFEIKDAYPKIIVMVSFEDLILRPEAELKRICAFLNIKYEIGMLNGTKDTGFKKYSQTGFNIEKL